jgi:transposase
VRPIYHFVNRRVYGHVFVCFLAYVMLEALRRECKKVNVDTKELLEELKEWKVVDLEVKDKRFLIRTELNQKLQDSLRRLGIKIPSKILRVCSGNN